MELFVRRKGDLDGVKGDFDRVMAEEQAGDRELIETGDRDIVEAGDRVLIAEGDLNNDSSSDFDLVLRGE